MNMNSTRVCLDRESYSSGEEGPHVAHHSQEFRRSMPSSGRPHRSSGAWDEREVRPRPVSAIASGDPPSARRAQGPRQQQAGQLKPITAKEMTELISKGRPGSSSGHHPARLSSRQLSHQEILRGLHLRTLGATSTTSRPASGSLLDNASARPSSRGCSDPLQQQAARSDVEYWPQSSPMGEFTEEDYPDQLGQQRSESHLTARQRALQTAPHSFPGLSGYRPGQARQEQATEAIASSPPTDESLQWLVGIAEAKQIRHAESGTGFLPQLPSREAGGHHGARPSSSSGSSSHVARSQQGRRYTTQDGCTAPVLLNRPPRQSSDSMPRNPLYSQPLPPLDPMTEEPLTGGLPGEGVRSARTLDVRPLPGLRGASTPRADGSQPNARFYSSRFSDSQDLRAEDKLLRAPLSNPELLTIHDFQRDSGEPVTTPLSSNPELMLRQQVPRRLRALQQVGHLLLQTAFLPALHVVKSLELTSLRKADCPLPGGSVLRIRPLPEILS